MIVAGEQNRKFGNLLRQYVGMNGIPIYEVAKRTGIKKKTIESHMAGITAPRYAQLVVYFKELGPEFVTRCFEEWGYRAVALEGKQEDGCYRAITAAAAEFTAASTKAQEDGFVDHREIRFLVRLATSLESMLSRFRAVRRVQTQ